MAVEFKPFGCNIHAHSDCSLDGGSSVKKIVKRAKELGMGHLVLTEHGNINSAASLAMYASEAGLSYSHGIEVYLDPPFLFAEDKKEEAITRAILGTEDVVLPGKRTYMHLTILFRTAKAYEYFCKLTPTMEGRAQIKYGERKPIITWDELEAIGSELCIGSGCLVGFVQKFVLLGQMEAAERAYQMVRSIVPRGCFFVEVFPHCVTHEWQRPKRDDEGKVIEAGKFIPNECLPDGSIHDIQKRPNLFMHEMAEKYGDPVVISEDSHFAYPNQKAVQDARLGNGQENWRFYTSYHMRTPAECFENLQKIGFNQRQVEQMVDNSYLLKDTLKDYKFYTHKDRWVLPIHDGDARRHLANLINKHGRFPKGDPEYLKRLSYEIKVLADNGKADFLPYLFQVEDVASWCDENDVLMNLRGSAGGSLLYYLCGASVTDPIKYKLPFERHITIPRILANALPDADMDFSNKTRVVEGYIKPKLGDRAISLSTNINLKVKNSIRDAERTILGRVRQDTEIMCAKFPNIPQGPTEEQWLFGYEDKDTGDHVVGFWDQSPEIREYAKLNPEIWSMVTECLGVMRNKGSHACGFLITPQPAHHYFPITWVGTKAAGQLCTAFDPKSLEFAGGIKFDFLGVQTLEVIRIATHLIHQRHGVKLKWREYDHDERVYTEIFHRGNAAGVFQYNTHAVRPFLMKLKPMSVAALAAITALVRPGCLDAPAPDGSDRTCAEYYVAVANGEVPYYLHPDMESILKETNGIVLYQEQLLQVYHELGGYTLEAAEDVRRAISKKDKIKMQMHGSKLKAALLARGWTEKQADIIDHQLIASSKYSFNKAHAASYAIVGYNCAYLKQNFPLEFWTAELTVFGGNEDKLRGYVAMLSDNMLQPSISKSGAEAWKIEGDKIRAPLAMIKGIGPASTEAIIANAPYVNVEDFAARCSARAVNRAVFVKLVLAGLFDEDSTDHDALVRRYWKAKGLKEKDLPVASMGLSEIQKYVHKSQLNMLTTNRLIDIVGPRLKELGWISIKNHDAPWAKTGRYSGIMLADVATAAKQLSSTYVQEGKVVYMVALFMGSKVETTRSGKKLLKVQLSDGTTEFEAVDWNKLQALKLDKETVVIVSGRLKKGYKIPVSITMGSIETL